MASKIKFCQSCANTKKNSIDAPNEKNVEYAKGYIIGWDSNITKCPFCKTELEDIRISIDDYFTIRDVSNYNRQLLEAMIKLHDDDIIEYEIKMSQFRNQLQQQKQIKQAKEESSKPRCPHCNSTDIKSVSALNRGASIALWGIFSKKINKSFECRNCGYTW